MMKKRSSRKSLSVLSKIHNVDTAHETIKQYTFARISLRGLYFKHSMCGVCVSTPPNDLRYHTTTILRPTT
ncbi:hypothetical protein EVAR_101871_1 [Eumeta japonica]|uniref:Uncharacterized protein n=1 Tax=Eumeta variegata TaxID=151549 RepID=A0A4C1SR62_EUMVA|nr:hypothetical protein EVAR_101871_1 [Eumeta japonica]